MHVVKVAKVPMDQHDQIQLKLCADVFGSLTTAQLNNCCWVNYDCNIIMNYA